MSHVGIDVSKDRLDVHVLPEGEAFAVARDGKGLAELVERMRALGPERIAVEATGGFETVVAAALAGAALPVIVVNPAQARHFRPGDRTTGQDRSDRRVHDRPLRRGDQARGAQPSRTRPRNCWPIWSRAGVRSSK